MTLTIITVGAKPNPETAALIHEYTKRLPKHIHLSWHFLKHGSGPAPQSKQQEAERILKLIPDGSSILLLDELGKEYSSPELSSLLFDKAQDVSIVIGGAYGVDDRVKKQAHHLWSLGKLVYPHQLVRIILAEQLYRAYSISAGSPYHHE